LMPIKYSKVREYLRNGKVEVLKATIIKKKNNDDKPFVECCLIKDKDSEVDIGAAYDRYVRWCYVKKLQPVSRPVFGRKVLANMERRHSQNQRYIIGWKLKEEK